MPTTATATGNARVGDLLTCTLTGYASDILSYQWQYFAASSGGSGTAIKTNVASSVTDAVDTFIVPGSVVGKWVACVATLDGEEATSNRIGPIGGGSGASRRSGPRIVVRRFATRAEPAESGQSRAGR